MDPKATDVARWIQTANAAELAGVLGLAFARLVALAGLPSATGGGPPVSQLVSVAQAAKASGMSRRWFYDHAGEPFMRRLGARSCRVDLAALERWMQGQR